MGEREAPVIAGPGEGTAIEGPVGGPLTFKARAEQTGGRLTALENVIPPGQGPPLHTHDEQDEAWYVLDGELRFLIAGALDTAAAGSFVFVPRGVAHCFDNPGDVPVRILVLFAPAGMEPFFEQMAALDEPDPEAFARLGGPLGMTVLGPPLAQSHPL